MTMVLAIACMQRNPAYGIDVDAQCTVSAGANQWNRLFMVAGDHSRFWKAISIRITCWYQR